MSQLLLFGRSMWFVASLRAQAMDHAIIRTTITVTTCMIFSASPEPVS